MKYSITKLILARNSQDKIQKTIESLKEIPGQTIVGDLGNNTIPDCDAKVIKLNWTNSYSVGWNELLSHVDGFVFVVNPGETVIYSCEEDFEKENIYGVAVVSGDWMNYSTRIWHTDQNIKYHNRVFEETNKEYNHRSQITLLSNESKKSQEVHNLLEMWSKEDVKSPKVSYYKAMFHLSLGDLKGFHSYAHEYLFRSNSITDSTILIWLYLAFAEINLGKINKASEWASLIIAERPWLAEAWCISAEASAKQKHPQRACLLYKMAIAAGKMRPDSDRLPIDIGKYRDQPSQYIKSFEDIVSQLPRNSNNDSNFIAKTSH